MNKIDFENKTLGIVVLTAGEDCTFRALDNIRKNTPCKYELIVWYNCIKPFDPMFHERLREFTDDIVICTKNKGSVGAYGYAFSYLDYDFILIQCCDVAVTAGYLERLSEPFQWYEKLAMAGQSSLNRYGIPHQLWTPFELCPDKVMLWNREALGEVGSISPSFKIFGDGSTEHIHRTLYKGWNVASVSGVVEEITNEQSMSKFLPNRQKLVDDNIEVFKRCAARGYTTYDWWAVNL